MNISVVIPNWHGIEIIGDAIKSLQNQTIGVDIIVVENASTDGSYEYLKDNFPDIKILRNKKNLGFDGGVNTGIRYSLKKGYKYIALLNSDAVVDKKWAEMLVKHLEPNPNTGIVASKIVTRDGKYIDSVGDYYTIWGLAYPTGRGEKDTGQYEKSKYVFGGSGGASMYRAKLFKDIGIFDEDFFAYYEDIDISFRAQLAGWKVWYEHSAVTYHATNSTSKKMASGFMTYQTLKNMPWVLWKNVPLRFLPQTIPRFMVAYLGFIISAIQKRYYIETLKGTTVSLIKFPKKILQRSTIQRSRAVSSKYIKSILVYDLPPNAEKLRRLRHALRIRF